MDAKKMYRILSVLFFVLTVLFLFLYFREDKAKSELSDEFIAEAVSNIRGNGIEISDDIIQKSIPHKDIYSFEIENADDYYKIITDALADTVFVTDVLTSRFETPDGISVNIYSKDNNSELGRIIFNNSDLSFVFLKNGVNISGTEKPVMNGRTDLLTAENTEFLSLICENLINDIKTDFRISGCSGDKDSFVVTACQTVNGYDISDSFINFLFDGNELVSISGKWLVENIKVKYNNILTDGVNALYSLDLQQIKSIDSQRIVYVIKNSDSNNYYLIPIWEISYVSKNGEKKTVLVDAI